jgi:NADH dehydrogenase [ubiquinone] 1 alpha subcomplex assembly factor 4
MLLKCYFQVSTKQDPNKPLPLNKKEVQDFEYGFQEPENVSRGRITLRNAMKLISDHQVDPQEWTSTKIASTYTLKENIVGE